MDDNSLDGSKAFVRKSVMLTRRFEEQHITDRPTTYRKERYIWRSRTYGYRFCSMTSSADWFWESQRSCLNLTPNQFHFQQTKWWRPESVYELTIWINMAEWWHLWWSLSKILERPSSAPRYLQETDRHGYSILDYFNTEYLVLYWHPYRCV